MTKITPLFAAAITAALFSPVAGADVAVDFTDLTLPADSYYNGSDEAGGFTSQGVHFSNDYDTTYGSWSGFAYSNVDDTETAGWGNQYAVYTGTAQSGDIYAVAHSSAATVTLPTATTVAGAYFTNTTYAALSMRDGDAIAKQFNAEDGDWFRLTVHGLNAAGESIASEELYLADFRPETPSSEHYILDSWEWLDLTSLGEVHGLTFDFASSDVGDWGMNTPAYVAMDGLTVGAVPEPGTLALLAAGGLLVLRRRRTRLAN